MSRIERCPRVVADDWHLTPESFDGFNSAAPGGLEISGSVEDVAEPDNRCASVGDCSCDDLAAGVSREHGDRLDCQKRRSKEA
jgi:hypothetical protein